MNEIEEFINAMKFNLLTMVCILDRLIKKLEEENAQKNNGESK